MTERKKWFERHKDFEPSHDELAERDRKLVLTRIAEDMLYRLTIVLPVAAGPSVNQGSRYFLQAVASNTKALMRVPSP